MSSSSTMKRVLIASMGATLLLGACRSDGGIGRRDTMHGMRWTLDTVSRQCALDEERTSGNLDAIADWFAYEVSHPTEQMRRTMSMYLEGHAPR